MTDPKAYFLQADKEGVSLHSHIAEVLQTLLTSKDPNALANFESTSLEVKAKHFKPTIGVPGVAPDVEDDGWKKRSNALFMADPDEEQTGVPNVVEEMGFFEFAGVGLAREDAFRLYLAMSGLKETYGLKSVRFFGKILGTKKDYYVVEGTYATKPAATPYTGDGTAPEEPGSGLNACAYYVANGVSDAFELLPDTTPDAVLASMAIKKYFTGELGAPVNCYPPFPGAEKEYLRAQIARIAQATVLVPAGKFQLDEEVEEGPKPIIPVEEYEPKAAAEMTDLENWCRLYGGILKIGRCTNVPKVASEEEEEEAPELEEEVPALAAVGGDAVISTLLPEEELPAWTTKLFNKQGGDFTVAVARSHRWPGAFSAGLAKADKFANLYIGHGTENTGVAFTPVPPPAILAEAEDVEEQADVTLDAENALLKSIEESKMVAEGEEEPEEE